MVGGDDGVWMPHCVGKLAANSAWRNLLASNRRSLTGSDQRFPAALPDIEGGKVVFSSLTVRFDITETIGSGCGKPRQPLAAELWTGADLSGDGVGLWNFKMHGCSLDRVTRHHRC